MIYYFESTLYTGCRRNRLSNENPIYLILYNPNMKILNKAKALRNWSLE